MKSPWRITVCDTSGRRVGQVLDYSSLRLDARCMGAGEAVGTCTLVVPRAHRRAGQLGTLDGHIVVEHVNGGGRVEWSGVIVDVSVTGGKAGQVSVIAEAHDALLRDSLLWPVPASDVSASATTTLAAEFDARTGNPETTFLAYVAANIGPSAGIARRRYSWLVIPSSLGRGTGTATGKGRWGDLLQAAKDVLIPAGLACRVVHLDPATAGGVGRLAVEVWVPTQAPAARWSEKAGTVADAEWHATSPRIDDAVAGGSGDGTARVFTRRTATQSGRWRREAFVDASSADNLAEIRADVDAQLAEASATEQMTFRAVERLPDPGKPSPPRFGVDFHVGDIGTVSALGKTVTDVIRRVELDHSDPRRPAQVAVTVGWPDADPEAVSAARARRDTAAIVRS